MDPQILYQKLDAWLGGKRQSAAATIPATAVTVKLQTSLHQPDLLYSHYWFSFRVERIRKRFLFWTHTQIELQLSQPGCINYSAETYETKTLVLHPNGRYEFKLWFTEWIRIHGSLTHLNTETVTESYPPIELVADYDKIFQFVFENQPPS